MPKHIWNADSGQSQSKAYHFQAVGQQRMNNVLWGSSGKRESSAGIGPESEEETRFGEVSETKEAFWSLRPPHSVDQKCLKMADSVERRKAEAESPSLHFWWERDE